MIKFEVKRLDHNIFVVSFSNHYDLAMTFLRWSEFDECRNRRFYKQHFTILDFMEWYSKNKGNGIFTYPKDWHGFNLNSKTFLEYPFDCIPDFNKYDKLMKSLTEFCFSLTQKEPFYLIGQMKEQDGILEHELAHALYGRSKQYKSTSWRHYIDININIRKNIENTLIEMGYADSVIEDEANAYLSTGLSVELERMFRIKRIPKKIMKPFQTLFKEYSKGIL